MSKSMEIWEMDLSSKSRSTQRHYNRDFKRFLDRWGITADELFKIRLNDLRSLDTRDHKQIERMVKTQMNEMKRSGLAASTCKMLNKAVSSFLESQGLDLKVKAKDKPKGESVGKRMMAPEEIRTLLGNPGMQRVRNTAMAMFAKDSGLRISDIAAVNLGDYLKAEEKRNIDGEPFRVFQPFETIKEGILAYIHIGPEAVEAVEAYLEERREKGETLKADSPLFLMRSGERYTPYMLSRLFTRWKNRCGLPEDVSEHSLRKTHTTMLQTGKVPDTWICKLQGKSTRTSFGVYSRPEELPGELTQAYMSAYDRLRVFGKEESEALDALRLRNEELARKLDERDERLTKVEVQLAEVVKLLSRMK